MEQLPQKLYLIVLEYSPGLSEEQILEKQQLKGRCRHNAVGRCWEGGPAFHGIGSSLHPSASPLTLRYPLTFLVSLRIPWAPARPGLVSVGPPGAWEGSPLPTWGWATLLGGSLPLTPGRPAGQPSSCAPQWCSGHWPSRWPLHSDRPREVGLTHGQPCCGMFRTLTLSGRGITQPSLPSAMPSTAPQQG